MSHEARRKQLEALLKDLNTKLHDVEEQLDAPAPADAEDRASEREEDEVLERFGQHGLHEMRMIHAALARIDDGTFGECMKCGEQISEERLNLLPFTPFCRRCAV